jgi:uncharacterized membrane protein
MTPTGSTKPNGPGARAIAIAGFGQALFAVTMIAVGIVGLVKGAFLAFWTGVPRDLPARAALAYLCAVIALGSGAGLLWRRSAAIAARVLLLSFALWMLVFRVPYIIRTPTAPGNWWACGETAVMLAAAWVLVVWFAADRDGTRSGLVTGERGLRIARVLCGFGLIQFGVGHFTFLERTVGMVPGWLPWHLGWAYFTGGSLILAGLALITGVCSRAAAVLAAWELGLFTLLVWVPIVLAGADASQWDEFVDSCVLTGAAWVVADSYRGMAWLGIGASRARSSVDVGR